VGNRWYRCWLHSTPNGVLYGNGLHQLLELPQLENYWTTVLVGVSTSGAPSICYSLKRSGWYRPPLFAKRSQEPTGNYVATVAGNSQIGVSGSGSETAAAVSLLSINWFHCYSNLFFHPSPPETNISIFRVNHPLNHSITGTKVAKWSYPSNPNSERRTVSFMMPPHNVIYYDGSTQGIQPMYPPVHITAVSYNVTQDLHLPGLTPQLLREINNLVLEGSTTTNDANDITNCWITCCFKLTHLTWILGTNGTLLSAPTYRG